MRYEDPLGRKPGEALDPLRHTVKDLEVMKNGNPRLWAALWQQNPRITGGGLIKPEWFVMTKPPEIAPIKFLHTVRAWDLAFSEKQVNKGNPDFSVGCKMGLFKTDNDYFYVILDLVRWRGLWPVTKRAIIDLAKTEGTGVKLVLESGGPQKGLADDMKAEIDLKHIIIHAENPVADKVARAQVWADKAEAGKIMLLEAAWNADFLSECSDFPNSEHDDQVDSVSLAYYNLSSRYVRRQSFLTVGISGLYSHG